jgi:hypothetical protein
MGATTPVTPENDIVNLFVKMKDTDELEGEKRWKSNGEVCMLMRLV